MLAVCPQLSVMSCWDSSSLLCVTCLLKGFFQVTTGVRMTFVLDWPKKAPAPKDAGPSNPTLPPEFMPPRPKMRRPLSAGPLLRSVKAKAEAPKASPGIPKGSMRPPEPKFPPRPRKVPPPASISSSSGPRKVPPPASSSSSSVVPMAGGCIPSWRTRTQSLGASPKPCSGREPMDGRFHRR